MVRKMKLKLIKLFIFAFIVLSLVACNDPVFYLVSQEVPLRKPKIGGSPSRFVEFNGKMYVATGRELFAYENDKWHSRQFHSRIRDIAATDSFLYVCLDDANNMIRRTSIGIIDELNNLNWQEISTSELNIQKIFGAGDNLLISAGSSSFTVHYISGSSTAILPVNIPTETPISMLCGTVVSGGTVFLCSTERRGIFYTALGSPGSLTIVPETAGIEFTSIINPGNNSGIIFAIDYDGKLYRVTTAGIIDSTPDNFAEGRKSTGALAIWENNDGDKLLLAGRQDVGYSYNAGYTYGYVEIAINATLTDIEGSFKEPGTGSPTTVDNNERYASSIGKNPVPHIHQATSDKQLFASTQSRGVWSYRERDGYWQWNAEE
jgi:hypothetical protein